MPAGTSISIREIGNALSNGDLFSGQLAMPVRSNGEVVLPEGSAVIGRVSSVDPTNNTRTIQLNTITLPAGNAVEFNSIVTLPMPETASLAENRETLKSGVTQNRNIASTLYPRVGYASEGSSKGAKILGGTVGGAALGAATGTLTGLTMKAVDSGDYAHGRGTMAARGLAWGTAYGAGFGLLSGLIAAASSSDPVAVTSSSSSAAYTPTIAPNYDVTLAQPVIVEL